MQSQKVSLVIPAYYIDESYVAMTERCVASEGGEADELLLQVDERGSGYSKTVNTALEAAQGDILVIGNNDITFHQNWLVELLLPLQAGYDISTCWSSNQPYTLEDRIEADAKFDCLWAMRRAVYEKIGGLDERFRGYFADTDYRRRALNMGFRIGKNCSMVVEHVSKATYRATDPTDEEYKQAMKLYELKHGFLE